MDLLELDEQYSLVNYPFVMELIAGGCCGLAVDGILFPIDTCKTRLQSEKGFWRSGGFKGVYNGIGPVLTGSVPTAAIFFCVYSFVRKLFPVVHSVTVAGFLINLLVNLLAASIGEMFADFIRVPVEIVKQKHQVNDVQHRAIDILVHAYKTDGLINGIYRGYGITIMRDIPFSAIQYPMWELLRAVFVIVMKHEPSLLAEASFGSVAGACASAATTPLDVAKTRIQLAEHLDDHTDDDIESQRTPCGVWRTLYKENGIRGIFSGFVPRVLWTTVGGFIWFGTHQLAIHVLKKL